MSGNLGGSSGSHPTGQAQGLGASRVDPGRASDLLAGFDEIERRLDGATSFHSCGTVSELEEYHDTLVNIVQELNGQMRLAIAILDGETK